MKKTCFLLIILLITAVFTLPADHLRFADERGQRSSEIAAKEILSYIILVVQFEDTNPLDRALATSYVTQIYNKIGAQDNYFKSKKLAKTIYKNVLKAKIERYYRNLDEVREDRAQFRRLVLDDQIIEAKNYYSNDIYALTRIGLVYAENNQRRKAREFLNLAYLRLAHSQDQTLKENCLPLIVRSYLEINDFTMASRLIKDHHNDIEGFSGRMIDLLIDYSRFDEAFEIVDGMSDDRGSQVKALLNIAIGYGDADSMLRNENREILRKIVLAASKG